MENSAIFNEMPLLSIITNFSNDGGLERVYLVTGRKPAPNARNRFRNAPTEEKPVRNTWNGRVLQTMI
jgi:hypothetical protein